MQKPIDKLPTVCYNIDKIRNEISEVQKMEKIYYVVEDDYVAFENYDDALVRCAELGIYAPDAMIWECPEFETEDYEIK